MKRVFLLTALILSFYGKVFSQVVVPPISGYPVVYTGWTLLGGATGAYALDSEIVLTKPAGAQAGRVYTTAAYSVTACGEFTVNFDFQILAHTGTTIADGITFFFLSSPVGAAGTGMSLNLPPNPVGLVLVMDTYDNNGDGLEPDVALYGYNGTLAGYTENSATQRLLPTGLATHQNFVDNGAWHHCFISYNAGVVKVYFDYSTTPLLTGNYSITYTGQFGFSGSTGGSYSTQSIKNVYIRTNSTNPVLGNTGPICQGSGLALSDSTSGGTWSSSNTSVATVGSGTGAVIGTGVGTATITYSYGTSCTATTVVTVNVQPAAITGTASVCEGATTALTDATSGGVWTSTATTVATVGTDGTVTASSTTIGTSTISYTIGSCAATKIVTVNTQSAFITGNVPFCQTFSINLTDATTGVTWSSSNTSVATVSGTGVVTGSGVGTSTISCGILSCYATTVVTVNTQPAGHCKCLPGRHYCAYRCYIRRRMEQQHDGSCYGRH